MKEDFLNSLKQFDNFTYTENGAIALKSTMNKCLDAFGALGAMKDSEPEDILHIFIGAFNEDRMLAMRLLFYIRDVRGGQGMRRVFRICLTWLAENEPTFVVNNLDNIMFFGRGDDYLCLLDTNISKEVMVYLKFRLKEDILNVQSGANCSLLAKWMPSENTSSLQTKALARKLIDGFGWTPRQYRKILSKLRKAIDVTEVKMSAKKWSDIDYEKVPAKASIRYSDAFYTHDDEGYTKYLEDVANGKAKINAKSLFPVDIVHEVREKNNISLKDRIMLNCMWNSLPDYFGDNEETGICMIDTSGSMDGTPIEVALSLGMYCADKCKGPFKNHFITFSSVPKLVEFEGKDFVDRVKSVREIVDNTNIEAAFDLILSAAKQYNLPQSDLPSKLYIISDMQFDQARGGRLIGYDRFKGYVYAARETFMETMRAKYAAAGYTLPAIIYWNVRASHCGMFQETFEGESCAMVSGYSASLFKSIIDGTTYEEEEITHDDGATETYQKAVIDPMTVMITTLMNERYDRVYAGE